MVIGLPPVLNFGSQELKAKVIPEIFSGKKFISLAISEAFAGSDVAGLRYRSSLFVNIINLPTAFFRCTATKSDDGTYWTINGTKKQVKTLV
jgi:alkylation response protein AidB-like acyl-CoA dehydrogenase